MQVTTNISTTIESNSVDDFHDARKDLKNKENIEILDKKSDSSIDTQSADNESTKYNVWIYFYRLVFIMLYL